MAILPPVQLLSWSSARLLALLLNALSGLFQYLDKDTNAIINDNGNGKAITDWDTPLGLRLIHENLWMIDQQLRDRGFHPSIFSAIRNLSAQNDLLLKKKINETRNKTLELFGKLAPLLFTPKVPTELSEHKLVDEGLRWSEKEQSERNSWQKEHKHTNEQLWIREEATGLSCLLFSMHPNCEFNGKCAAFITAKGNIGTVLTNQLFFLLLIREQLTTKCSQQMSNSSSFFNKFPFKIQTSEICANIFDEFNAWTVQKNGKKLARANVDTITHLTEQAFLCGHKGFFQFANPHLLVALLSWQHPKLGCWTNQKPDLMNNFGIKESIAFKRIMGMPIGEKMNAKNEKAAEMSSQKDAFCLPRMSILAGLAICSVYLRFLLDPAPWPENNLAEQMVQIDGVLAEDKFRQFPYLEWVRDSLIAGDEPIGLHLGPPSSSWSPDLIALIFLLFFIVIIFVLFVNFFGNEKHPPTWRTGTVNKKIYPYAFKKL